MTRPTNSISNISCYLMVSIAALLMMTIIRLFEYFLILHYHIYEASLSFLFQKSIISDLNFVVFVSIVCFIPFFIGTRFNKKISLLLYKVIWFVLIFISVALTHFFISGDYLLTDVLFKFTIQEITHIVLIESSNELHLVLWLYLCIPLCFGLFFYLLKIIELNRTWNYSVIGMFSILILVAGISYLKTSKDSSIFNRQYEFYLAKNKTSHFVWSFVKSHQSNIAKRSDLMQPAISSFQKEIKGFHFISDEYPLIHDEKYNNVLGEYFTKSTTAPNLVFIVSEGLSSSFAGFHPTTIHLLPFVDSLASQGLYWENFLSNCHRTYGVLPNVFGSLTSGTIERGFVNFKGLESGNERYPQHNSLIKELKGNNYYTSFYYGGWGEFDSYRDFIEFQNIDAFIDNIQFDSIKYVAPWNRKPKGFYWGYDDKALFNQWFDNSAKNPVDRPYFNIFMTLNMHEPYNIIPDQYSDKKYIGERMKKLNIENNPFQKTNALKLGSIFFYEDALREFFKNYQKRDDYYNTIFVIVGDHQSVAAFLENPLDYLHVPLIIFSPLIKEPARFKGVSTHLDIAPSLIALLQENYGLTFPKEKHWLGMGLDTSKTFHCDCIAPLNVYSPDFAQLLYHNYLLTPNGVLKINDELKTEVVTDKSIIDQITEFNNNYISIDNYVCRKDKIWKY